MGLVTVGGTSVWRVTVVDVDGGTSVGLVAVVGVNGGTSVGLVAVVDVNGGTSVGLVTVGGTVELVDVDDAGVPTCQL